MRQPLNMSAGLGSGSATGARTIHVLVEQLMRFLKMPNMYVMPITQALKKGLKTLPHTAPGFWFAHFLKLQYREKRHNMLATSL